MNKKLRIASIMLYITSIAVMLFGLVYLFSPKIMPYHERYIGVTHEELPGKVSGLMLYMLKGAGGMALSIGIALFMMVKFYFIKNDKNISPVILMMILPGLITLLFITLSIGLYTPWWFVSLLIILVISAIIINR